MFDNMINNVEQLRNKVAIKIKLERTKRRWSQERLAEMADLSKTYINGIEQATSSPTLDTLAKIAAAFEMEVTELIDVNKVDL